MALGEKPEAKTYYEITNVNHSIVEAKPDYSEKAFTMLSNTFTADGMYSISTEELEVLINSYENNEKGKKYDNCVLKGLYDGYYSGADCYKNAPYLFYDVDVKDDDKKQENVHLINVEDNTTIYKELEKLSVLCWRSNSGFGIAGVLYVPQISNYLNDQKHLHLQVGESITSYLSEYLHHKTGVDRIVFDNAQSKFRQPRFFAQQRNKRFLNPGPFQFNYQVEEKIKYLDAGVIDYKKTTYSQNNGTLTAQFNNDNSVLSVALDNGFEVVSQDPNHIRVKHQATTSTTSGYIDESQNLYFNYSHNFSNISTFNSSSLLCYTKFNNDWSKFYGFLRQQGYKEIQPKQELVEDASKGLKIALSKVVNEEEASRLIYSYCSELITLTPHQKQKFIDENCVKPEFRKFFINYLKHWNYKINYDATFIINDYVSEQLESILNYADAHKKVVVRAETGKGKTTAFVRDFQKHRPSQRLLILVPLTIILRQNQKEYKGVFLDGTSEIIDFEKAKVSKLVFATYEQGVKVLQSTKFDYVVVDEVHQLITANSYKKDVINNLTPLLGEEKVIGLTGTPNSIFKNIGYKLINVDEKKPEKVDVEVRFCNSKPFNIALSHLLNVKGKTLLRLNSKVGLEAIKKHLVATKTYRENEILILHSAYKVKASKEYRQLAHERLFDESIKIVLTTSLIDEGVSINQFHFTDVVFIENSYTPRPEALKQFFARFRNKDTKRNNYLYLRAKDNQAPSRFNPDYAFNTTLRGLKSAIDYYNEEDYFTSYNGLLSNNDFYFSDGKINLFYLGFEVTQIMFSAFNVEQFLEFIKVNYNLRISRNNEFELSEEIEASDVEYRRRKKQKVAHYWCSYKDEVSQCLYVHSLDKKLKAKIEENQILLKPEFILFIVDNIKYFEKLFKRYNRLKELGEEDPNKILLKIQDDVLTLDTDAPYKKAIDGLKLHKMVFEPQNKRDREQAKSIVEFVEWCKRKSSFTFPQMAKELKKHKVYKHSSYSIKQVNNILNWFNYGAIYNKNSGFINVVKI